MSSTFAEDRVDARRVGVAAVGLASAQGSLAEISARGTPHPPTRVPPHWRAKLCTIARPARHVAPELEGAERWNRLARLALDECLADRSLPPATPLVLASCNGAAAGFDPEEWRSAFDSRRLLDGTPWRGAALPILSASCASGLQALSVAAARIRGGAQQVVVLAVDILSQGSHQNFESLRVLSESHDFPWQLESSGFIPGEAAVALLLTPLDPSCASDTSGCFPLEIEPPALSLDLENADGLAGLLAEPPDCEIILGQGTGPQAADRAELAALHAIPNDIPIATPVYDFGHTLGPSALISLALLQRGAQISAPPASTLSGRPTTGVIAAGARAVIVCRAMGGMCGLLATVATRPITPRPSTLGEPVAANAISIPALRSIGELARANRPEAAPSALIVRLAEPLVPPDRARIGGRILPSAVLEMTPGCVAITIARAWGYAGPAYSFIGHAALDLDMSDWIHAAIAAGGTTCLVSLDASISDDSIDASIVDTSIGTKGETLDVEWQWIPGPPR